MNVEAIQSELQKAGLDGWLFFDHHERDPLAYRVLGLKPPGHVSRRWYYFIPARGEPRGLVHQVEPQVLHPLPGAKIPFEVDDAVSGYIASRGMAHCIRHRTGHSIGREVHGVGANMDNMETRDERPVIPWTCFSVEPALYLPTFGVRTEVNVFVEERGARVTGEIQNEFVRLC